MARSDRKRRSRRTIAYGLAVLTAAISLAGCGGGSSADKGLFDDQGGTQIHCLDHQTQTAGTLYTGGANADTAHILQMMQYYTAYGSEPFCDGKVASTKDRAWAQLYVDLGGTLAKVSAFKPHAAPSN